MPPRLDKIAHDFRSAILAGDHTAALRLVMEYAAALQQVWMLLPQHQRASSEIPRQALELLGWARAVTITQRVLAAEQLAVVEKIILYRPVGRPEARSGAIEISV